MQPGDPWVTDAPVHVWRRLLDHVSVAACGASSPSWYVGVVGPQWNERPCPDCLAALAAEALVEQDDAADLLAEWAP